MRASTRKGTDTLRPAPIRLVALPRAGAHIVRTSNERGVLRSVLHLPYKPAEPRTEGDGAAADVPDLGFGESADVRRLDGFIRRGHCHDPLLESFRSPT